MAWLAVLNVGSRELTFDGLTEFVRAPEFGPAPLMDNAGIAEYLSDATDDELLQMIGQPGDDNNPPKVRNEPCFVDLDERAPSGWHIGLFANESEEFEYGNTMELAGHFARWLKVARPDVTVHGPFSLLGPPHLASDELSAAYEKNLQELLSTVPKITRIVVLALGGTPAMRVLLERSAQVMAGDIKVESLTPMDDRSGVHRFGLLSVIRRDEAKAKALDAVRSLCNWGLYAGAAQVHRSVGILPESVLQLLDVGSRIARNEREWVLSDSGTDKLQLPVGVVNWEWRTAAWIELIEKAFASGSKDRALQLYVTSSEALPAVWAQRWLKTVPWIMGDNEEFPKDCDPAKNAFSNQKTMNTVTKSQRAAGCAGRESQKRCEGCPFRNRDNQTFADIEQTARFSTLPRWGKKGWGSELNSLRNRWIHPGQFPQEETWAKAISNDRKKMNGDGSKIPDDAGLAGILRVIMSAVTGEETVPKPLAKIDSEIDEEYEVDLSIIASPPPPN